MTPPNTPTFYHFNLPLPLKDLRPEQLVTGPGLQKSPCGTLGPSPTTQDSVRILTTGDVFAGWSTIALKMLRLG